MFRLVVLENTKDNPMKLVYQGDDVAEAQRVYASIKHGYFAMQVPLEGRDTLEFGHCTLFSKHK
jgi:hypothetical protein